MRFFLGRFALTPILLTLLVPSIVQAQTIVSQNALPSATAASMTTGADGTLLAVPARLMMCGTRAASGSTSTPQILSCDASGLSVHGSASAPVQQGGTIAASGGKAAVTFVADADTEIVNPSTATLWGSWGTPAVNGANSYPIAPSGSYRPPNRPAGTFTLLSTIASQPYTATRF